LVNGSTAGTDVPPNTQAGEELGFLNQVAAASIQFATVIQSSATKGKNSLTYPTTGLGRQLGIVSKLVSGGLNTPIYLVNIGGFDTHSNQLTQHANLWRTISEAVSAFQTDLKNQNLADRVSVMTFSEFGRRINQNGSLGTDHGTAAPMFIIGKTVRGGIVGANPDLTSVDANGDLKFKYDYRQVYSTVLRDHLGLDNVRTATIFQSTFERLPLYNNSIEGMPEQHTMELLVPWPNPIRQTGLIQYGIFVETDVLVAVYDIQGRLILNLFEGKRAVGSYSVTLEGSLLASGHYILSLQNLRGGRITRSIQIQND
jgi:hypothetical protein